MNQVSWRASNVRKRCRPCVRQLHRLTWWTRHSTSPRVDLTEEPGAHDACVLDSCDPDPRDPPERPIPLWRRTLLRLCGLSGASSAVPLVCGTKLNSLKEAPLWRNVCNANALLLLAINVFLWGYYA